jgi:hypothetical protein
LGLESGSIFVDWDAAHNMHFTWADLIKKQTQIMKVADGYFNIMKVHKLGKVGTYFMNRAKELGLIKITELVNQLNKSKRQIKDARHVLS